MHKAISEIVVGVLILMIGVTLVGLLPADRFL